MNAREIFDSGLKWTDVTTRAAFPIVLGRALDGELITYGDLDKELVARGKPSVMALAYRTVAGKIGNICEAMADDLSIEIPPLNAIIVNQGSGLPSHGVDWYLAQYFGRSLSNLSPDQRDAFAQRTIEAVLAFNGWKRVGQYLGISLVESGSAKRDRGKPIDLPDPKRFATGLETDAHKSLKDWGANNPAFFKTYGEFKTARTEKVLSSGDRLDVFFDNGVNVLAVEVKAKGAHIEELKRGVFQCIKYRAVLKAMQLSQAKAPNGNSVLLLEERPVELVRRLAQRLSVEILVAPSDRMRKVS